MFAAIGISHRRKYITKMVVKKKDGGRSSGDGEKRGFHCTTFWGTKTAERAPVCLSIIVPAIQQTYADLQRLEIFEAQSSLASARNMLT